MLKNIFFGQSNLYKGTVEPEFVELAKLFSRLQDGRLDQGGASLVVYHQQRKVVDIYVGKKSDSEDWSENTMSMCYSTGKGILATLAHIIVSQGFLNYDQPIAEFWPEFAQNGKSKMTLADVLSHRSGLYDLRNLIDSAAEMNDWEHMLKAMEEAQPRFEIGKDYAYQALTFGWLVGGILEKATKQELSELMKNYLVDPLELDGAYFGLPIEHIERLAIPLNQNKTKKMSIDSNQKVKKTKQQRKPSFVDRMIELSGQNPQDFIDAMIPKAMKHYSFYDVASITSKIPAANGVFTARSLAKIYAMMANKGLWAEHEFVNAETFKQLSQIQTRKRDRVMPIPMHWRLGYHRVITLGKRVKHGFGHMGYNGSGAWCDPDRELSFAYTHNFPISSITGDYRLWSLSQKALICAEKKE